MSVQLAVVQMAMARDTERNIQAALARIRAAVSAGATIVLLPELFQGWYFPQTERAEHFGQAHALEGHPFLPRFQDAARALNVVLPVSFFERAGQAHYNSLAMIDADGKICGVYRKSHIPDGPGYEEKFYFNPGDSGFRTFSTRHGRIGVAICWDQWFPESARCMTLRGADVLLYPTAIGSEPAEAGAIDTREMWQRVMVGHAVANSCYLAAANRVGVENEATFYGSSFIVDYRGDKMAEANRTDEAILYADLDLPAAQKFRAAMGFFRDRRPDLYAPLLTQDGVSRPPGWRE